jgi:hypothetical protein
MDWFRWHNGTASDPKWRAVARKAGAPVADVLAVWAMLCENANQSPERGTLHGWDAEDAAAALDLDAEVVERIVGAMNGKVIERARLTGWEKRNPPSESSAERVRRHREKKVAAAPVTVTDRYVTPQERDREGEEETTLSINPSTRVLTREDEGKISLVIRLANRGMCENPLIDQQRLTPLNPSQGDLRQTVADWWMRGIDWPTMEATVYDRATKYKPGARYRQIGTMAYFSNAVVDAYEKRAALDVSVPEIPTEAQAAQGFGALSGGPAAQEWAERVDARLREAMESDATVKAEADAVRANLRRLNEQERDFKNMRASEQEAFLWIRILNWYGEKIADPRPSRTLVAA